MMLLNGRWSYMPLSACLFLANTTWRGRFEREAKGRDYDPAIVQLTLSFAAIHTTTDLVTQVMSDLCKNPEIVDDLRQEMVKALSEGEWKKTSLYNMKLLDSVIKESLRIKPTGIGKAVPSSPLPYFPTSFTSLLLYSNLLP